MKHSLDMRQGQSLVMTPQLQQAIKLLQLSNQELAEFVEAELERNPLLVKVEEEGAASASDDSEPSRREQLTLDESSGHGEARDQLDAPGEDVFEPGTGSDSGMPASSSGPSAQTDWSGANGGGSQEPFDATANVSGEISLHEHLHTQLNFAGL
ncbi:MAG: RNA polymerase sigma-54 factor, partial [Hyphomonas sp.]